MINNPLLSVCLITYNHEKYIRKALKGIFMQKINFPIEVIIADDYSTDATRQIILEYKEKYSDIIRLIFQEKNIGPANNWMDLINSPKGKYIAYFEGDDYWTDPNKLQKQVDFLENNDDFAICCHNIQELDGEKINNESYLDRLPIKSVSSIEDLAKRNFIATLSAVFRNQETLVPNWILSSPIGDLPLFMKIAESGKIKYFEEKMGVYRKNVGVWSKIQLDKYQKMFSVYDLLLFEYRDNRPVYKNLKQTQSNYIKLKYYKKNHTFISIFKDKNFIQLSFLDKIKIIIKNLWIY